MPTWLIASAIVVACMFIGVMGIGYWLLGRYLDDIEKRDAE